MKTTVTNALFFLAITACLTGCGGSGLTTESPSPPVVSRIAITPASIEIFPGETQQFSAALYGTDGSLVSGPGVTWKVDDPTVAVVSGAGLLQASKPGEVSLTVQSGSAVATAVVYVKILGTYVLRTANGMALPTVITQGLTCPPNSGSPQRITVYSGELNFVRAAGITPISVAPGFNAFEECGGSTSTWQYGNGGPYTVKGNTISFAGIRGWEYSATATFSNDSIYLRWKGDRSATDSLSLVYTK